MSTTFPQRVAFEDHRFMQAIDLEDEQLYHLQRRWQHNLALHSWGILCGLEVRLNDTRQQQPNFVINPGMALDGYGRELVVTSKLSILQAQPTFDPAITYDVWLTYNSRVEGTAANQNVDCADSGLDRCWTPPDDSLRRVVEEPLIVVRPTSTRQSGSVAQPRDVPLGDLHFSPERPMKFDPSALWPVFLCKLEFAGTKWTIDESERHYGGLIAERIELPSSMSREDQPQTRQTAILNGGHPDRKDWRFAVLDLPGRSPSMAIDTTHALPDNVPAPLSIRAVTPAGDSPPTTEIRWQAERVVAEADIVMRAGAGLQFEATPVAKDLQPPTTSWGIYRSLRPPQNTLATTSSTATPGEPASSASPGTSSAPPTSSSSAPSETTKPRDENTAQFADVLQIAMPTGDPGRNSVAIGAVDADGKFSPILVVTNDETVDIYGMLRVHGTIFGDTTDLPPLDKDKARDVLRQWLTEFMKNGSPITERKQFVTALATGARPEDFRDGMAAIANAQTPLYTAVASQIVGLMPDNAGGNQFAKAFAASLKVDATGNPAAHLIAERNLYKALARQIVDTMPDDADGNAFAAAFADSLKVDTTGTTAEQVAHLIAERNLYKSLARQIVDLMPDDADGNAFAATFAASLKVDTTGTTAEQVAHLIAERNLYKSLARQIVDLMPDDADGNAFAATFADSLKVDATGTPAEQAAHLIAERNLYKSLARQIVDLMPDDADGNAFAAAFADSLKVDTTGTTAEQAAHLIAERNLYKSLARQIVDLMPDDADGNAFAAAFADSLKVDTTGTTAEQVAHLIAERNLYKSLARQIVDLMPDDADGNAFAATFADSLKADATGTPAEQAAHQVAERNLYQSLIPQTIDLMNPALSGGSQFATDVADALPVGNSGIAQFYNALGERIRTDVSVFNEFKQALSPAAILKLKTDL